MPDDFVQKGKQLLQGREFAEVVKVCRQGLLSRPALVDGRLLLGTALLALRRYDEVLAEMRVAAELDQDHVLVHLLKGEALLRKGEAEQAVESLAVAVQLDPQNPVARKLYSEARVKAGLDSMSVPPVEPAPAPPPRPPTPSPSSSTEQQATTDEVKKAEKAHVRRRRWPWIAAVATVVVLGAGGLVTMAVVRSAREHEQVAGLREAAGRAAADQTYPGYVRAARIYARAVDGGDAASKPLLARVLAAAALELGVRLPGEAPAVAGRDAQIIAVYEGLVGGQTAEALKQAVALEEAYPDDGEVVYLAGRAQLLAHDPGAVASLRRAVELQARPLAWTALGEAEAAAGHVEESIRAFDAALVMAPGHPAAIIARARVLAAAGRLPPVADPQAPDKALADLASVEAATPRGEDAPALSPAQQRLAVLALAEVKLARGDAAGARAAAATFASEGNDARFGEIQVAALLAGGDVAGARSEAEKWKLSMPASGAPRAWLARVALAEDNLEAARVALADAGDASDSFQALLARGELELLAGNLEGAAAELDKALAVRAGDRAAIALRARVDLEQGDAAAAEARVATAYEDSKDPTLAAVLGEALRRRGARARARALLEEASLRLEASSGRPSTLAAVALSLARLHHDEGRYADAQHEVGRALALRPQDIPARLLSAQVRFDLGDLARAGADVDTLAVAAHTSPEVLLLAARVHTASGDLDEARNLLEEAGRLPSTPPALLQRERARLALAGGRAREAVELLGRGSPLPEDDEACVLLVVARLHAGDKGAVAAAEPIMTDVARRFVGRPEENLARGYWQLAHDEPAEAAASFAAAAGRLEAAAGAPRAIAEARLVAGDAFDAAGRPDDSLASYRDALRVAPASAPAGLRVGRALFSRGDALGAFDALSQAVKNDPTLAEAQFHLGEAAIALKKGPAAKAALEAYLKLTPAGPNAEKARRMLSSI